MLRTQQDKPTDTQDTTNDDYTPPRKLSRLHAKYESLRRRRVQDEEGETPVSRARMEVRKYLEQIRDTREFEGGVWKFWVDNKQRYPLLYPVAVKLLGIPASSTSVERVVSRGGGGMLGHGHNLSSELMSITMFLKCNAHLLL